MEQPFTDNFREIADSMGISLYQRFSFNDAALFLRCNFDELAQLVKKHKISYIQVTDQQVDFFGFQLLSYLLKNVVANVQDPQDAVSPERILRSKELQEMTGLSRTTLWRLERKYTKI